MYSVLIDSMIISKFNRAESMHVKLGFYVGLRKNLHELLKQSKELGFIMYTRLDETLRCFIVD